MENFIFQNPTKLVFGKGQIGKLKKLLPKGSKMMITFGGGSVKNNGVYKQVIAALDGFDYVEFWGIEPNPTVETLRNAVNLGKKENVDFLLAVGGGSVLDGTKLVSSAIKFDGDPWELVLREYSFEGLPFASVMTLPATGSEMNNGAVISRKETKEKRSFYSNYPQFSILDPETTYSLPDEQIAAGLADIYVHVIEQYLTTPGQSRVMDRWAEGLLSTVLEIAPKITAGERDYDTMADFMFSATMTLNDFIRMGVSQDWATHLIGHEITALHGITHGASLAIVLPGTMRVLKEQKKAKLIQYGERVFGITEGSDNERADKAIKKTEEFFRSLGLKTRLHEVNIGEDTVKEIRKRFEAAGYSLGENRNVTGEVAAEILRSSM